MNYNVHANIEDGMPLHKCPDCDSNGVVQLSDLMTSWKGANGTSYTVLSNAEDTRNFKGYSSAG